MKKTLKRQALDEILSCMDSVETNFKNYGEPEYLEANSKAMKNLAMAYTLVKRGVMLPDWIKDEEASHEHDERRNYKKI